MCRQGGRRVVKCLRYCSCERVYTRRGCSIGCSKVSGHAGVRLRAPPLTRGACEQAGQVFVSRCKQLTAGHSACMRVFCWAPNPDTPAHVSYVVHTRAGNAPCHFKTKRQFQIQRATASPHTGFLKQWLATRHPEPGRQAAASAGAHALSNLLAAASGWQARRQATRACQAGRPPRQALTPSLTSWPPRPTRRSTRWCRPSARRSQTAARAHPRVNAAHFEMHALRARHAPRTWKPTRARIICCDSCELPCTTGRGQPVARRARLLASTRRSGRARSCASCRGAPGGAPA